MLNFLLRTIGAMLLGAGMVTWARLASGSLGSAIGFLACQICLILLCDFTPISALLVTLVLLGGVTLFGMRKEAPTRGGFHPVAALSLLGFFVYWITAKYLLPLGLDGWLTKATAGAVPPIEDLQLFAMVGISYIGFKAIHFVLDWRAGQIKDAAPVEVLSWLFFFPSIVAGPIQRFQDWQAQRATPSLLAKDVVEGLQRLLQGMFMKFVLADNLRESTLASMSAGGLTSASFWQLSVAAFAYSFYIYWDFAGYSHMAIGIGRFWGIRLPENFNWPFLARNLNEFWQRWHITLSGFLRDYVFYPLSLATKRKSSRTYPNVAAAIPPFVTFLGIGVWHGAAIGFLIFGALHGAGVAFLAVTGRYRARPAILKWWMETKTGHALAVLVNFVFVTFSFVFFALPAENLLLLAQRLLK